MTVTYNEGRGRSSVQPRSHEHRPVYALSFYINRLGGQPFSYYAITLHNDSGSALTSVNPAAYATDAGVGWYRMRIPLSALGAANTTITRVVMQENTGAAQPVLYIDNLSLYRQ